MEMTVIYFIYLGKDCQTVFRADDPNINLFTESLEAEGSKFAKITLNQEGEVVHG